MNNDCDNVKCVFCEESCIHQRNPEKSQEFYKCGVHGKYAITDDYTHFSDDNEKSIISAVLFETRKRNETVVLTNKEIKKIVNSSLVPKTSMQKLNKIMTYICSFNKGFDTHFTKLSPYIGYAKNEEEMCRMLKALCDLGYLSYQSGNYNITIKGLEYVERLLTTNEKSTKVFVAMGFKQDLLEAYENAIKPICYECGYQAFIVSDKEHNNDINDEIIAGIRTSKFVIVDFTYNNEGAYFEAGFAQGLGLPVIRCCKQEWFNGVDEKDEKNHLHFDIEHYNLIIWKDEDDLKKKLKNRILATI